MNRSDRCNERKSNSDRINTCAKVAYTYANEADMLNEVLFEKMGMKEWENGYCF